MCLGKSSTSGRDDSDRDVTNSKIVNIEKIEHNDTGEIFSDKILT